MTNNTQISNFYFIECLDSNELNSTNARSLYNDSVSRMKINDANIDTGYFEIKTKKQFLETLDFIESKNVESKNTLIHIYLHGSRDLDGLIDNDKTLISWEEILEKCRAINIKSKNGLFLILALCHGKYIGTKINIRQKAPFNSLIASKNEEFVEKIYNLFEKFYNNLVFDNNIYKAFSEAQTDCDNFYFQNTNLVVAEAYKSLIKKREQMLPKMYQEFLSTENAPKLSFEQFEEQNRITFPAILNKMKEEFFIK